MGVGDATESALAAAAGASHLASPAIRPSRPPPAGDTGADDTPTNPRKRKKASRACDYCHLNHQPCDNGKPRCGVCQRHNKPCSYLRPTKRRGPQKGYRTALNTYKESAAAWGVVLGAIPGLDALVEGHLRSDAGKCLLKSVKDPAQQDALIQRWQQSTVFKTFFPADSEATPSIEDADAESEANPRGPGAVFTTGSGGRPVSVTPTSPPAPAPTSARSPSSPLNVADLDRPPNAPFRQPAVAREPALLSDILAKDAARSSSRASQTLVPLGFAPDETIADFYDMGANPEQIPRSDNFDELGTDAEQRVYYELLMGRSFDDPSRE